MVEGLASNEIFSIVQDRTGYLWIGTNNGLQRFDGIHYKTFKSQKNNPHSISSNVIIRLMIDAKDNLWLLTNAGEVGLFDKNTFVYTPVPVISRKQNISVFAEKRLITDEYGNIFLSIRGDEVLRYDEQKRQFGSITSFIPLKEDWGITSLSQQPGTQKYWMGLQTGGLVIYNRKTGNLSYTGHNVENEPAIEICGPKSDFAYSFFDKQGRVWFHQWGGGFPYCMQYDTKRNILQRFEFITTLRTYHELRGFVQLSNGQIGVYGLKVLALFNEDERKFELIPNEYRNGQGINYEEINTLYEDREKNIWVTTRENGLYRFNPSTQYFTSIFHLNRTKGSIGVGSVMSFIETKNGELLTGTWEDGPFRYTTNLKNIPLKFRDSAKIGVPYLWSLCASADSNTIWMGAQPGLIEYDQQKGTQRFRNPAVLQNHTIRQLAEDKGGNLWLGMHAFGLYRWVNPKDHKIDSVVKMPQVANAMVNRLMINKYNEVWVGTGNEGLFVFDAYSGRMIKQWKDGATAEGTMLGSSIMAILQYNDSLTLIGGLSELFFYNRETNKLKPLRLPDAIMGNISSLERDDDGFIWMGTTNALYRFHPDMSAMVLFNRLDGMSSDHFNLSASYKMKDGRMLFGTSNSFICFNPKNIRLSDVRRPIVITGIQAGKTELHLDSVMNLDMLTLGDRDNSLRFTFSPLYYSNSLLVQYKMENIDNEWKVADKDNTASFPYLPPGHYTLMLRSLNAEGIPYSSPTVLKIRILPPFYQTWWFYTLLALMMAFLLFWFDRQRTMRKEAMQKVRSDIANGLHEEVNTALNNINILSEIARLKSDKEPQRAKEYLEQIHNKSHNMIIALDDMLWSLDPENDAMDKTISRIKEYADALMQRHGVLIELLIDKKVEKLELNMKMRHEAFLLFKEGLHSLVTAGTKLCIVHLTAERGKLLFTIEFENEGCDMQQLNNLLRRRDMEARLHELKAKLNVQVHKSRSVFSLQLPLN
jgi:ligand-binding sensor domain-containing protein